MGKLHNKIAVITGGNSGIGLSTAQDFIAEGAKKVIITGRNEETLKQAVAQLGDKVSYFQVDVLDIAGLEQMFVDIAKQWGNIDVLFVNAGVAQFTPVDLADEDHFDYVIDINLKGAYFSVQKALPYLNDNASIIFNTSVAAHLAMAGGSVYGASKAALLSLARTLSADLVSRGIRVNAVSPGPIETPIYGRLALSEEQINQLASNVQGQVLLGRFGQPDEIAKAVTFLASDDSSFVVGQEFIVDGGMTVS